MCLKQIPVSECRSKVVNALLKIFTNLFENVDWLLCDNDNIRKKNNSLCLAAFGAS